MAASKKYPYDPLLLGNVFLVDIPKLTKAFEDALNLNHFRASIIKTGVFPSAQHPKIFWLGISYGTKKMMALHEKVKKIAAPFKESEQKKNYPPHYHWPDRTNV